MEPKKLRIAVLRSTRLDALRACERLMELGHDATPLVWGERLDMVGKWWHVLDWTPSLRVPMSKDDIATLESIRARIGSTAPTDAAVERYAEAVGRVDRGEAATHRPAAKWALALYQECQRDAAGDPWYEPGGAERRFIAKLREYAGGER